MRLLTAPDENAKLNKGDTPIYGLSLAPHTTVKGGNLCPDSTPGCRAVCLYYQGRARIFKGVKSSRIARTKFFHTDRMGFITQLVGEIDSAWREHRKLIGVRLNMFSDHAWELSSFPFKYFKGRAQFFDYTKTYWRLKGPLHNYHLTYSRSETNHDEALAWVRSGRTATFVYVGELPESLSGCPVFDGDKSDERWLDPKGHWIGLELKATVRQKSLALKSGFAIRCSRGERVWS